MMDDRVIERPVGFDVVQPGSGGPAHGVQRAELVEDWDGFEAALVEAYFENGRKAREAAEVAKNSEPPSATTT